MYIPFDMFLKCLKKGGACLVSLGYLSDLKYNNRGRYIEGG